MFLQRSCCFASIALCLGTINSAHAVDLFWDNQSASVFPFYTDASFWSTDSALTIPAGAAPVAGDNIFFLFDTSPYNVILTAGNLATNVTASNGDVTLTGPGGTLASSGLVTIDDVFATGLGDGARVTLNSANWDNVGDAIVGDAGFGSFSLNSSGDFRSEDIFIGNQLDSVGVVNVDGVGTTLQTDGLNNANGFRIGQAGTGTLNVTGGGLARIVNDVTGGIANFELGLLADGEGTLNISGTGSQVIAEDVLIGRSGTGHLNITAGGVLNQNIFTSANAFVALEVGSSGDVTVNGDGSQWLMARLEIGNFGDATLSIEDGGLVRSNSNDMALADAGGSGRVAVFGAGVSNSTLQVTNDLYVGSAGLGELYVGQDLLGAADGNGSLIVGSDLFIGNNSGNNLDNKVVVSGANATANISGTLQAGVSGTGTFEARNGATITVGSSLGAGGLANGNGTILIDGLGTTLTSSTMFLGNGNAGPLATGVMTVSDQAVVTFTSAANGVVTLGDEAFGEGTLTVTGDGSLVQSAGGTAEWWVGGSSNDSGGTGTLNILDGGNVTTTGRIVMGHGNVANSGSSGTIVVDGAGSQLDASGDYILIGFQGLGNMDVTNGGTVNANRIFVGDATGSAGSQLDIDGVVSVVNITRHLHVGDSARGIVNVTGGGQLDVATSNLAERLIIGNESGTDASRLTVSGAGSRVDYFGTTAVSVGGLSGGGSFDNPVILEVLDGGVFETEHVGVNSSNGLFVADQANTAGLVTVDGVGSLLRTRLMNVSDDNNSRGTVNITGGGMIDVDDFVEIGSAGDGDGFLTVLGAGSRLDVGGDLSAAAGASNLRVDGTITVIDGGAVTNGDQGFIGRATTNVGTVNVGGAGALATWDVGTDLFIAGNDSLAVGGSQISGSGTLNVLANGRVTVNNLLVLKDRGVINLDGGELAANDILFQDFPERALSPTVNFNSGTLRFTNPSGKTLDAASINTILGGSATLASGQHLAVEGVTVLGGPVRVNGGTLSVGAISKANFANVDFDAGTLNFTNSGLVVTVAGIFGSTLVVDEDETINVATSLFVQADGLLNVARGSISAFAGVNSGTTVLAEGTATFGSSLTNDNTLVVIDSTINGDLINNGTLEIVGVNTFGGSVTLSSTSSLSIDIGGTQPGEFDLLEADDFLTLDGTLNVSLDGGFAPQLGDSFGILRGDTGFSGIFDTLNLPALNSGLAWQLNPGAITVFLDVVSSTATPGDFDLDGDVDGRDFLVWQRGGSPNGTNSGDLALWQGQYGNSPLVGAIALPESLNWLLMSLAAMGNEFTRRRRIGLPARMGYNKRHDQHHSNYF